MQSGLSGGYRKKAVVRRRFAVCLRATLISSMVRAVFCSALNVGDDEELADICRELIAKYTCEFFDLQ